MLNEDGWAWGYKELYKQAMAKRRNWTYEEYKAYEADEGDYSVPYKRPETSDEA